MTIEDFEPESWVEEWLGEPAFDPEEIAMLPRGSGVGGGVARKALAAGGIKNKAQQTRIINANKDSRGRVKRGGITKAIKKASKSGKVGKRAATVLGSKKSSGKKSGSKKAAKKAASKKSTKKAASKKSTKKAKASKKKKR